MSQGCIEQLSTEFATGWALWVQGQPALVYARLRGAIIGHAVAAVAREDLQARHASGGPASGAFLLLFTRPLEPADLARIMFETADQSAPLRRLENATLDRFPVMQVFVLGSPRSGTSELGRTLASALSLPWRGEFHGAPLFAKPALEAAHPALPEELRAHLAARDFSGAMVGQARASYFGVHGSASFLDKTPGVPMIRAIPFLARCFPAARFIYLRRNGISNMLSRLAKFGGDFGEHCGDWAAALEEWAALRGHLPSYLEVRQEEMLEQPEQIAHAIAQYLDVPELGGDIAASLESGRLERTGAGIGRLRLADTGWNQEEIKVFMRRCGPTMQRFGYEI